MRVWKIILLFTVVISSLIVVYYYDEYILIQNDTCNYSCGWKLYSGLQLFVWFISFSLLASFMCKSLYSNYDLPITKLMGGNRQ